MKEKRAISVYNGMKNGRSEKSAGKEREGLKKERSRNFTKEGLEQNQWDSRSGDMNGIQIMDSNLHESNLKFHV